MARTSRRYQGTAWAAAAVLPLCVLSAARPAVAQVAAAPNAAAVDPLKLMPPSTLMVATVNIASIETYMDAMKNTLLGSKIQKMIQGDAGGERTKGLAMALSLTKGIKHEVTVGLLGLPPAPGADAADAAARPIPDFIAVAPVENQEQVQQELDLVSRFVTADGKMTLKDEPEGDNTVHVLQGDAKPGMPQPAFTLIPGALVVGSSGTIVHNALKGMDGQTLGSDPIVQSLLATVDRRNAITAYLSPAFQKTVQKMSQDMVKKTQPAGAPVPPDVMQMPGFKEFMAAYQGASFYVKLQPDQIELGSVSAFDPASTIGKKVRAWQAMPLKAPTLASGKSLAFFDMADMPHFAPIVDSTFKPMMDMMTGMLGQNAGLKPMIGMFDTVTQSALDIVHGSGGEIAMSVGAFAPGMKAPAISILIQKSDDPRLQKGIDSILHLVKDALGSKSTTKTLLGTTMQIIGPADSPVRPSYAVIGDFHVITLDPETLKTPLYLIKGNVANRALSNNADFMAMQRLLGADAIGTFYIDAHSIGQLFLQNIPPAGPKADPGSQLGMEFVNGLGQIGATYYANPLGLGSKFVLTMDPDAGPPKALPAQAAAAPAAVRKGAAAD